ncbi:hypothetical protein Tco_1238101 [Tanacetum coccineum]
MVNKLSSFSWKKVEESYRVLCVIRWFESDSLEVIVFLIRSRCGYALCLLVCGYNFVGCFLLECSLQCKLVLPTVLSSKVEDNLMLLAYSVNAANGKNNAARNIRLVMTMVIASVNAASILYLLYVNGAKAIKKRLMLLRYMFLLPMKIKEKFVLSIEVSAA